MKKRMGIFEKEGMWMAGFLVFLFVMAFVAAMLIPRILRWINS